MKIIKNIIILLTISVVANCSDLKLHQKWGYSGKYAPKYWGDIDPEYKFCKIGSNQSPIVINSKDFVKNSNLHLKSLSNVELSVIKSDGIVRFVAENKQQIKFLNTSYQLRDIDFHHPSEHIIDGKANSLEMQITFKSNDEQLLSFAIMLEVAENIGDVDIINNKKLIDSGNDLAKNMAKDEMLKLLNIANEVQYKPFFVSKNNLKKQISAINKTININLKNIINFSDDLYFYNGSSTTPPCYEGMKWYIFKTPIKLEKKILNDLIKSTIYNGYNARDTQKFNSDIF